MMLQLQTLTSITSRKLRRNPHNSVLVSSKLKNQIILQISRGVCNGICDKLVSLEDQIPQENEELSFRLEYYLLGSSRQLTV